MTYIVKEGVDARTRDNRKATYVRLADNYNYPFVFAVDGIVQTHTSTGLAVLGRRNLIDLVADWVETPQPEENPKDAVGSKKWRQISIIPRQVLWEVGVALLEGALKYGPYNYRKSKVKSTVYLDAAYGHLDQFCEGEDIDKDSGLSHVTKAISTLVVLRDAMMQGQWVDDRPPKITDIDYTRKNLQDKVDTLFKKHGVKTAAME